MSDMSIDLCGISLRNPLIVTSGPLTGSGDAIIRAAKAGAGAVINRSIYLEQGRDPLPCCHNIGEDLLNASTYSDLSLDQWVDTELPKAMSAGIPIIGSIYVPKVPAPIEEYVVLAERISSTGVKMLHVVTNFVVMDQAEATRVIQAIRKVTDLPIIANLTYSDDIDRVGLKLKQAGVDGFLAVDGPWAMKIDVDTGLPITGSMDGTAHICGPSQHPVSVFCVYQLARKIGLPIIGCGGVKTGSDVAEFLLAGASAAGLCSSLIRYGVDHLTQLLNELEKILQKKKIDKVQSLIGATLRQMALRSKDHVVYHPTGNIDLSAMRASLGYTDDFE